MNIGYFSVIPLVVIAVIGFLFTLKLVFQILTQFRGKEMIIFFLLLLVYGSLGFLAVEFDVIGNAFATFLTLFAALLSRAYSLSEAFSQYNLIKNNPQYILHDVKNLFPRLIEVLPDIILMVLLFVLARDIKEKFEVGSLMMAVIYISEFLYALVLFSYIGIGDKTAAMITKRNGREVS